MSDRVKTLKIVLGDIMPVIQKATQHGVPWSLVHSESFASRAVRRERYYKTGRGREELDRLIK
jgi:hypothetical protein